MKQLFYIILLTILGCNNATDRSGQNTPGNQTPTDDRTVNTAYYISEDTLYVELEVGGTIAFEKEEFNRIVDAHPELYTDFPKDPDITYNNILDKGNFESEVGKDDYYVLYTYFLRQSNGIEEYHIIRKKLNDIFQHINELFRGIQLGGTFFGHQYLRIMAYAEYAVYLYSVKGDNFEKTYDITRQKDLYIKSLRQLIDDEIPVDSKSIKEQIARWKEMHNIVDELNVLITDNFYLRRAQEFHYRHYSDY